MNNIQYEGILSNIDEDRNILEFYPEIKSDTSLSTSGKAADANVVGDKVVKAKSILDTKVSALETKLNSFEIIKSDIVNSALGTALSMSTDDSWDDITGALEGVANKGAWNGSISTSGGSVTIPKGYHSGSGKVTGPTLANLIGTNVTLASSSKLLSGYTAYGKNGTKYTGTASSYSDGYEDGKNGVSFTNKYHSMIDFTSISRGETYTFALGFKPDIFLLCDRGDTSTSWFIYIDYGSASFKLALDRKGNLYVPSITVSSNGLSATKSSLRDSYYSYSGGENIIHKYYNWYAKYYVYAYKI